MLYLNAACEGYFLTCQVFSGSEDWKSLQLFSIHTASTFRVSCGNGRPFTEMFWCRLLLFCL